MNICMLFIRIEMICYSLLAIKFSEKGQKCCELYKYGLYQNKFISKVQVFQSSIRNAISSYVKSVDSATFLSSYGIKVAAIDGGETFLSVESRTERKRFQCNNQHVS